MDLPPDLQAGLVVWAGGQILTSRWATGLLEFGIVFVPAIRLVWLTARSGCQWRVTVGVGVVAGGGVGGIGLAERQFRGTR